EAVVKRNRNAQAVGLGQLHACADEVAVVNNIAVTERSAFRHTGRARGVLNVDRIVELQRLFALPQFVRGGVRSHLQQVVPVIHAGGRGLRSEKDEVGETR